MGGFSHEKNQGAETNQVIFQAMTDVREILGDKIDEEVALGVGRGMAEGRHG